MEDDKKESDLLQPISRGNPWCQKCGGTGEIEVTHPPGALKIGPDGRAVYHTKVPCECIKRGN